MKILNWLFLFLILAINLFAVPNEGHVKHLPNSLCLLDKSEVTWDISVPDGDKTWIATSGQINGVNIPNINSGKHQISWPELGEFTVAILITYKSGDLEVPVFRLYQINVYGSLKILGPEVVCLTNTGTFKVELCDGENAPSGVNWDITGDGHVVGNGDVQVDAAWNSPSGSTNDKTVTARYGTLEASKKLTVIQISSETIFEDPAPRTRTTIGVGEKVKVFVIPSDFNVSWSLNAGSDIGSISSESGNSTIYTSSKTANTVEIKANYNGESICPYPIETIEPSGVLMKFDRTVGTGIKANGTAGLFIETSVYILPNTVNFSNIKVAEGEILPVVTGYFDPTYKDKKHEATATPMGMISFDILDNLGTLLEQPDQIKFIFGHDDSNPNSAYPITAGSFSWNIPWNYHYDGKIKRFIDVEQRCEFIINSATEYKFTLSKGGVVRSITGDPR